MTFIEGTYVNGSPELRYLNPFMIIHSFSNWNRGLDDVCAYMGFYVDYVPVKNLRIYALYAQNEIRGAVEASDTSQPNGIGFQLGTEAEIAFAKGAWKIILEGLYTMPWLYVKPTPQSSLVTFKHNEHSTKPAGVAGDNVSWLGTPFGPDSAAGMVKFGYEVPGKWQVFAGYLFLAQGENAFADVLFYKADGKRREGKGSSDAYYPSDLQDKDEADRKGNMMAPSGTPQYTNRLALEGSYAFSKRFSVSCQVLYSIISNCYNIKGNTQHGAEVSLSGTCVLF